MHFIRFLKLPTTTVGRRSKTSSSQREVTISALLTISTDLSESFYPSNVTLRATLRAVNATRTLLTSQTLYWTAGMRSIPVTLIYTPWARDAASLGILCVSAVENRADDMRGLFAVGSESRILSAWSTPFGILEDGGKGGALVERKLQLSAVDMIRIWEETREDIARHIWPGGLAITSYVSTLPSPPCGTLKALTALLSKPHLQILELGAGCGLAGMALHTLFPSSFVTLTDLPITAEITKRNLSLLAARYGENGGTGNIAYAPLDWAEPLPDWCASKTYDLILVADCTYNTASIPHLVAVIDQLCGVSPGVTVLLAHKVRHDSEEMFFDMARDKGLVKREQVVFEMAGDTVDLYVIGKEWPLV
ncbi:hypothetical protein ABW21_db0202576 [Orbilia brochopaga]|nr:hypothetical protein ABW21_db0202576 [Drechslerella brochopaga]